MQYQQGRDFRREWAVSSRSCPSWHVALKLYLSPYCVPAVRNGFTALLLQNWGRMYFPHTTWYAVLTVYAHAREHNLSLLWDSETREDTSSSQSRSFSRPPLTPFVSVINALMAQHDYQRAAYMEHAPASWDAVPNTAYQASTPWDGFGTRRETYPPYVVNLEQSLLTFWDDLFRRCSSRMGNTQAVALEEFLIVSVYNAVRERPHSTWPAHLALLQHFLHHFRRISKDFEATPTYSVKHGSSSGRDETCEPATNRGDTLDILSTDNTPRSLVFPNQPIALQYQNALVHLLDGVLNVFSLSRKTPPVSREVTMSRGRYKERTPPWSLACMLYVDTAQRQNSIYAEALSGTETHHCLVPPRRLNIRIYHNLIREMRRARKWEIALRLYAEQCGGQGTPTTYQQKPTTKNSNDINGGLAHYNAIPCAALFYSLAEARKSELLRPLLLKYGSTLTDREAASLLALLGRSQSCWCTSLHVLQKRLRSTIQSSQTGSLIPKIPQETVERNVSRERSPEDRDQLPPCESGLPCHPLQHCADKTVTTCFDPSNNHGETGTSPDTRSMVGSNQIRSKYSHLLLRYII